MNCAPLLFTYMQMPVMLVKAGQCRKAKLPVCTATLDLDVGGSTAMDIALQRKPEILHGSAVLRLKSMRARIPVTLWPQDTAEDPMTSVSQAIVNGGASRPVQV